MRIGEDTELSTVNDSTQTQTEGHLSNQCLLQMCSKMLNNVAFFSSRDGVALQLRLTGFLLLCGVWVCLSVL